MAGGNLSPRQKMINMMYLVLTALLALNVSKEVLNSFFEVNKGIERTTTNFNSKNESTYAAFDNAASNNPSKYQSVRDLAYSLKIESDKIILYIQEMKYNLVNEADGKVCLGNEAVVLDEEGNPKEGTEIEGKNFSDLNSNQQTLPIAYLRAKSDRYASSQLFLDKKVGKKKQVAYILSRQILDYRDKLVEAIPNNTNLINTINQVCDVSGTKKNDGSIEDWEKYNFNDMPAVGALTILSKIQSDMRNIEADVIDYLKRDIDSKSLKFTSAEGIQIPQSNFVLRGDSFRSEIFISAKQDGQDPEIFVGEYDSLGGGMYKMIGEYEKVKVINGKGIFSKRETSEGLKKYGGLISMKTETGTKMYPFNGEYLVAAKTAVVSPTNMNILYLEVDNPLKISVPGYTAGEISAVINNGKVSATKRSLGEYSARPSKKGKALVSLYANVEGKRSKMGQMEFRVKEVPPPKAKVQFAISANGVLVIDKMKMVNAGGLGAELKDFDFKGVRYVITSYRLSGVYKGEQMKEDTKGPQFTSKMINIIKNTKSGNAITISNIKAKRVDAKNTAVRVLDPLVIEIK